MNRKTSLKGFSAMHDTGLMPITEEVTLPQTTPRSPSLAQQLVHLLQQVLLLSQQDAQVSVPPRRLRGRPPTLGLQHLYLALLVGVLQGASHLSTIWRRLSLEPIGTFAPVQVTYEAVRKRLVTTGTRALEQLFEAISQGLAHWSQNHPSACSLAPFAPQVVALDETTLRSRATTHLRPARPAQRRSASVAGQTGVPLRSANATLDTRAVSR